MSFKHTVGDHIVEFYSELDYVYCRLEYLECKDDKQSGVACLSFLEFLQFELYDHDHCLVESIKHVSCDLAYNWSYVTDNAGDFIIGDSTTTTGSYTATNTVGSLSFSPSTLDISTEGNPNIYYNTDTSNIVVGGGILQINTPEDVWDIPIGGILPLDTGAAKNKKIEETEFEPEDPIEERYDILDL